MNIGKGKKALALLISMAFQSVWASKSLEWAQKEVDNFLPSLSGNTQEGFQGVKKAFETYLLQKSYESNEDFYKDLDSETSSSEEESLDQEMWEVFSAWEEENPPENFEDTGKERESFIFDNKDDFNLLLKLIFNRHSIQQDVRYVFSTPPNLKALLRHTLLEVCKPIYKGEGYKPIYYAQESAFYSLYQPFKEDMQRLQNCGDKEIEGLLEKIRRYKDRYRLES